MAGQANIVKTNRSVWGGVAAAAAAVVFAAAPLHAEPLNPGESTFKTHPTVPEGPKYTIGLPDYFTPENVVATLTSNITGGLNGVVTSTVYRNPDTGFLTFQYVFEADANNPSAIVRATIDGWAIPDVLDAGADASGSSGSDDPGAEWNDGDPVYLARDPVTAGLAIQWRASTVGSALAAGDTSANIWFASNFSFWGEDEVAVIDTAITGAGRVLVPIPLPTPALMGLAGLGLVACRRRRA